MRFEVIVESKKEVLDAEGRAICESMVRLGFKELKDVRVSRRFVLDVSADVNNAKTLVNKISNEFLANPISETYFINELGE